MASLFNRLLSDEGLIEKARADDRVAFEALVFRYQKKAYAIAHATGVEQSSLEDVVQEAFYLAFRDLPTLKEPERFGAWFAAIVRNAAVTHLRKPRPAPLLQPVDAGGDTHAEKAEKKDFSAYLRRKVVELPDEVREAIFLYYYEARSVREVARAIGFSRKAVESLLRRGRDLLRMELWRELGEVLPYMLPSAREWKRRGRHLTLIALTAIAGSAVTANAAPAATVAAGGTAAPVVGGLLRPDVTLSASTQRLVSLALPATIVAALAIGVAAGTYAIVHTQEVPDVVTAGSAGVVRPPEEHAAFAAVPAEPRETAFAMLAPSVLTTPVAPEVVFLRGDTNGDGIVDSIDAANIIEWLFLKGSKGGDQSYWDANVDGVVNIADAIGVFSRSSECRSEGHDETAPAEVRVPAGDAVCHEAFSDNDATFGLSDSVIAPGSAKGEAQVWLTTTKVLVGFGLTFGLEGVAGVEVCARPVVKERGRAVKACGAECRVSALALSVQTSLFGACERLPVLALEIAVPPETPPGRYTLSVTDARFSTADDLSAHLACTSAGTVFLGVPASADASLPVSNVATLYPPKVKYALTGPAALAEGQEAFVATLVVESSHPLAAIKAAIDFNECLLDLNKVERVLGDGAGRTPSKFLVEESPDVPAGAISSPRDGYVALDVEMPEAAEGVPWDPGKAYEVARLRFRTRLERVRWAGETALRFRDVGARGEFGNSAELPGRGEADLATSPLVVKLPGEPPPRVETPADAKFAFRLTSARGVPGQRDVPLFLHVDANTALEGFGAVLSFDPAVLEVESIESLVETNGEEPQTFFEDIRPATASEPFGSIRVVVSTGNNGGNLYVPDPKEPVVCIRVAIRPDVRPGIVTVLRFKDEPGEKRILANRVLVGGTFLPRPGDDAAGGRELIGGSIEVVAP